MVSFKFVLGETAVQVMPTDSVDDVYLFFHKFEAETTEPFLIHVAYGYPVYCENQHIGYVVLSYDDIGLMVHHYTLGRVELRNRWNIRDFYRGEFDNRSPF